MNFDASWQLYSLPKINTSVVHSRILFHISARYLLLIALLCCMCIFILVDISRNKINLLATVENNGVCVSELLIRSKPMTIYTKILAATYADEVIRNY